MKQNSKEQLYERGLQSGSYSHFLDDYQQIVGFSRDKQEETMSHTNIEKNHRAKNLQLLCEIYKCNEKDLKDLPTNRNLIIVGGDAEEGEVILRVSL